jgi:NADH-quinone oxidoreductase subunit A
VDAYLPLLVTFVLAIVFVLGSIVTARALAPNKPTAAKAAPYESGIVPTREPPERFPVRFYLVAMIFIVFDIEIIFLFPWAATYRDLGPYGLGILAEFVIPFVLVFAWLVSQGALDWGPKVVGRVVAPAVGIKDPSRTTATTIRRVGLEGRDVERVVSPAASAAADEGAA